MRPLVYAVVLLIAAGCAPRTVRREPPPLVDEGELFVFVQPFPDEARRLSLALTTLSAAASGADVPLDLQLRTLSSEVRQQRLLAHGRLPPGAYRELVLGVSEAAIDGKGGRSALAVPTEPYRLPAAFTITRGQAKVVWVAVTIAESLDGAFALEPSMLTVQQPHRTVPELIGYVASRSSNLVTIFDRRARVVTGAVPIGRQPADVVLDREGARAFVALHAEDAVAVLDVVTSDLLPPIRLRGGDRPRELALAGDGRTLLVLNELSNTLAFVDSVGLTETGRVELPEEPWSMVVERGGQRAYVLSRRAARVSVVDLATRRAVRAVPTDLAPVRAAIDRAGTRLYVVFEGSPYMSVFALPSLALEQRLHVGLGARFVIVDSRTDLVYVAADGPTVLVFDPQSRVAINSLQLPGPVTHMAIDDREDVLFLLIPARGALAAIDLTSRRTLAVLEPGPEPETFALTRERH